VRSTESIICISRTNKRKLKMFVIIQQCVPGPWKVYGSFETRELAEQGAEQLAQARVEQWNRDVRNEANPDLGDIVRLERKDGRFHWPSADGVYSLADTLEVVELQTMPQAVAA
jgi:hypothetical protein